MAGVHGVESPCHLLNPELCGSYPGSSCRPARVEAQCRQLKIVASRRLDGWWTATARNSMLGSRAALGHERHFRDVRDEAGLPPIPERAAQRTDVEGQNRSSAFSS